LISILMTPFFQAASLKAEAEDEIGMSFGNLRIGGDEYEIYNKKRIDKLCPWRLC